MIQFCHVRWITCFSSRVTNTCCWLPQHETLLDPQTRMVGPTAAPTDLSDLTTGWPGKVSPAAELSYMTKFRPLSRIRGQRRISGQQQTHLSAASTGPEYAKRFREDAEMVSCAQERGRPLALRPSPAATARAESEASNCTALRSAGSRGIEAIA
jgi:hypothetical protein